MNFLRASALVGAGLALTSMVVNCQDRDVSRVTAAVREEPGELAMDRCVPGQTLACMGGCGAAPSLGYQVCAADGRSYGGCFCPPLRDLGLILSPPDRSDGERRIVSRGPSVAGLPTTPGTSAGAGLVGAACSNDADCISGLDCLTAGGGALNFSGPAGGYCTVSCASDAACQAIDRGSECIGFAGQNICVRSCASRATPSGVSKCLDRADVMCVSVAALGDEEPADGPQRGLCLPACQSDAQCGPGLFCDLGNGLCTSERPAGDPVGSTCDAADSCASGLCLTLSNRFEGFCSGFCRFGGPGCGFAGNAAEPGAGCVIAQVPGEGTGDRGFCLELCQDASDCLEAGAVCIPTAQGSTTRVCVVPTAAPPVSPPDGGAPGGSPRAGGECSANTDCGAGLECLTPDSDPFGLGGGFAGGYCSTSCADAPCTEPGSVCVTTSADSGGFCLRACNPQTGGDCGARSELLCIPFSDDEATGFCLPDCTAGADCGDRVCDPVNGVCVPDTEPVESITGSTCGASADCGTGFQCLTPDLDPFDFEGGFGGGYCSTPCAGSCEEPGSVCVVTDANADGFCLRACNPQTGGDCGERGDLLCIPFSDSETTGFCVSDCTEGAACGDRVCDPGLGLCVAGPVPECSQDEDCLTSETCVAGSCVDAAPGCTADEQCDTGECDPETQTCAAPSPGCTADTECGVQRCDTASGACVDATCTLDTECRAGVCNRTTSVCIAAPAISVGGSCTSNADCAGGRCTSIDAGVTSFCSAVCTLGSDVGCEIYGSDAFCLVRDPVQATLGRCVELCNTSADCAQSGYVCASLGGTTVFNGRSGACVPPAPPPAPSAP